ncbi:hypothetical protein WOK_01964 [Enterococcus faecalis EnGen0359]|nr:hypothetical protein Q9E_00824 [Enterococcus faecalis EnGen0059]EOI48710.1 hypothetical protein UK1_01760 [Enterococcus faecalis EnGen0301]EOJ98367.1 hypothetical protein WOK_01964 [Enterococcus faecalis EnGen0359]EOK58555.1 hypothetical protein Q9C_01843 [Enterococcus faecalis EnGen0063]
MFMIYIELEFMAVVEIIFLGIAVSKSFDEKKHDFIGKDEIKDQIEEV